MIFWLVLVWHKYVLYLEMIHLWIFFWKMNHCMSENAFFVYILREFFSVFGIVVHTCECDKIYAKHWHCCRKRDPFQSPKLGSCLTLRNELSEETRVLTKQEIFIGKGQLGGEQQGKGTQENCSATWLTVSDFMVMGLVSGWSLASHSNSASFLVAHASLSQDGC